MMTAPKFFLKPFELELIQKSLTNSSQSTIFLDEYEKDFEKKVFLTDHLESESILSLAIQKKECHIIQNSIQPIQEKVDFVNRLQLNPNQYFSENFYLLSTNHAPLNSFDLYFDQTTDRNTLIEKIFSHFSLNNSYSRYRIFFQVINELIMNIQINAHLQSEKENHRDSLLKIEMANGYVGVSAIDFYGSLNVDDLLKRILNVQQHGVAQSIQMCQSGGAGIGTSMVYSHCDSFFVGCQSQKMTRISVVFPFNINENKTEFLQKSIHVIRES